MEDPEALKKAVAERLRKTRLPIIPLIVGAIIVFNAVSVAFATGQWPVALIVLLFFGFWVRSAVLPKLKRAMREVTDEVKAASTTNPPRSNASNTNAASRNQSPSSVARRQATKPAKPQRKHCKSCDIRHSPDTRYCRRCGAPLLR